jgi:UDP-glucose 4-epimerase
MTNIKKIIVTGGGKGIGKALANYLVNDTSLEVIVLDKAIGEGIDKRVKTVECDLTFEEISPEIEKYFQESDYIFHLACIKPSDRGTTHDEFLKNIKMTENVAKFNKNARVIYTSAGTIYGACEKFPIREEKEVRCKENDYYCMGKLESENCLIEYSEKNNWELIILRITNVYGSEFKRKGEILPNFFEAMINDKPVIIYGDGKQKRDRIFIEDLVKSLYLSLNKGISSGIFNIGSGKSYSTLKVAKMMGKILKKKYSLEFKEMECVERKDNLLDIFEAQEVLDFYPSFSFKKGLKIVLKDWLENYEQGNK